MVPFVDMNSSSSDNKKSGTYGYHAFTVLNEPLNIYVCEWDISNIKTEKHGYFDIHLVKHGSQHHSEAGISRSCSRVHPAPSNSNKGWKVKINVNDRDHVYYVDTRQFSSPFKQKYYSKKFKAISEYFFLRLNGTVPLLTAFTIHVLIVSSLH